MEGGLYNRFVLTIMPQLYKEDNYMNIQKSISILTVTAEMAQKIINDGIVKAKDIGKCFAICVCDQGGNLKAYHRMDGAPLLAEKIAQDKAYTAAAFGVSTDKWYEFIKDDPPLSLGLVHVPRLIIFGGGYPLIEDGQIIGGLGVSGGHYTEDMVCARYALENNGFEI